MEFAAVLFLVSLFVPPTVVLIGVVVALWPASLRIRRERARHIGHAVAHQ
jgi:hypothetical protein